MQIRTRWKEKMSFVAEAGGNQVIMDAKAPLGSGSGPTPKELVGMGIAGCTGMDVAALMRKYKEPVETFEILVDIKSTEGQHPAVFTEATLTYKLTGKLTPAKIIEAVTLSQTKYCGVSAMMTKAFPLHYVIELNGEVIGRGKSQFEV